MNFEKAKVKDLKLDPHNPRLPERLKNASESEVINWMLTDATLLDLMASIAENDFFNGEPIIVEKGTGIVIEGNRRIASIILLNNPEIAEEKSQSVHELHSIAKEKNHIPQEIWVYIVEDRKLAENYLGFRHITGVKDWPPLAKAKYLYHSLYYPKRDAQNVYKTIAREIGSKGPTVKRLITGFRIFEIVKENDFWDIEYPLSEENIEFSYITDSLGISGITDFIGVNMDDSDPIKYIKMPNLRTLIKIFYERDEKGRTQLGETRNIKILGKVLNNEKARRLFLEKSYPLIEAASFTDFLEENIREYLNIALYNLIEAQKEIHKIENVNNSDLEIVKEILSSSEVIETTVRRKLMN
jgi:hypothetical protein